MKNHKQKKVGFGFFPIIIIISILVVACGSSDGTAGFDASITVPYGSNDYMSKEWTLEGLTEHFDDLGFSDIKIDTEETLDSNLVGTHLVTILDRSEDEHAIFRAFQKGEKFGWASKVCITQYSLIMTVDNCPEFAEIVELDGNSPEWSEKWLSFITNHNGECIEFDGVITSWNDELWFSSGISYSISVEESDSVGFSAHSFELSRFEMSGAYHYNNYKVGMIKEGDRIHARVRLNYTKKDGLNIEYEFFEILK